MTEKDLYDFIAEALFDEAIEKIKENQIKSPVQEHQADNQKNLNYDKVNTND